MGRLAVVLKIVAGKMSIIKIGIVRECKLFWKLINEPVMGNSELGNSE